MIHIKWSMWSIGKTPSMFSHCDRDRLDPNINIGQQISFHKPRHLVGNRFYKTSILPAIFLLTFHFNYTITYAVLYPRPTKKEEGVYWIHLVRPSVSPSVRPSVCRRHGFRSISQVCFGISISNFICMLMAAIGRSLLIFSKVTFKMAAWRQYWIFLVSRL